MRMPEFIRTIYDGTAKKTWRAHAKRRRLIWALCVLLVYWSMVPWWWMRMTALLPLAYVLWLLMQTSYLAGSCDAYDEISARHSRKVKAEAAMTAVRERYLSEN